MVVGLKILKKVLHTLISHLRKWFFEELCIESFFTELKTVLLSYNSKKPRLVPPLLVIVNSDNIVNASHVGNNIQYVSVIL